MLAVDKENTRTKPRSMHRGRDHARPLGLAASSLKDGLALSVQGPRVSVNVNGLVELHELGLRPGVLLDEGPLHGLSKVLLEVVREDPLGLAELRSREGQTRVLVLPQVLELLDVATHLLQERHLLLVVLVHLGLVLGELVHIVLSELRHRRSSSLRPRLLSLSLSLSLSRLARAFLLFSTRTAA